MEPQEINYESEVSPEIVEHEEEKPELIELEKAKPEVKAPKAEVCVHKEAPAYDFTHIEKILSKMSSIEQKIAWLKTFLKQLQETQKAIMFSSWGHATSSAIEEQYKSMTPYIQTVALGIREVQKKIRLLSEERVKQKYPARQ